MSIVEKSYCKNLGHFGQVFRSVILHRNFGVPLMDAKNLPRQKYGFMVLPERILRSRIRNFWPFQNSSLLLEFLKRPGGRKIPYPANTTF